MDSSDIVVRVNNYKTSKAAGFRTDVHYSFYGSSIRKTREELQHDGVTLCMCKLPNSKPIESEWHVRKNKPEGIDYTRHYNRRRSFWFTDTYIPTDEEFLEKFRLLGNHQPTTGFAAILDVLSFNPRAVFLTGFDFFRSGIHNVNEPWRAKNLDDPIRHEPERELAWLCENLSKYPVTADSALAKMLVTKAAA